ncbi:glycosyltransferase [Pontibacter fetidus]|uniref:Glycosyltransferase n=1 Tax=Pontibacter fetidus TaxID=2700082 RepID=A0A6B2GWD5_9BACT|nr:glycosyltransferase [Pontibacter fetidus]NDK55125.1 glycosyltransferase [Pontibacter fetidus]
MKATVLHIIESLVIGGAEVLLTESLKDISNEYRHVVVYMREPATLLPEVKADKIYCLNYSGKYSLLKCVYRLRKILKDENVRLIHAHHYWPTIVARLAKPKNIKLISTVHGLLSKDAFQSNRLSLYLEQLTYSKKSHLVFVSEAVAHDYKKYVSVGPECSVCYNFVKDDFYLPEYAGQGKVDQKTFRLVAVGTLKVAKNHAFLLEAFELLKQEEIYLDIIGEGPLRDELQRAITNKGLTKVKLQGEHQKIYELLQLYDGFILASTHEGFGIAMVEAMAIGLPCILSDIEAHREVTANNELFFDLSSPANCAKQILKLKNNAELRYKLSLSGKTRAQEFKKEVYLHKIEALYRQYLS